MATWDLLTELLVGKQVRALGFYRTVYNPKAQLVAAPKVYVPIHGTIRVHCGCSVFKLAICVLYLPSFRGSCACAFGFHHGYFIFAWAWAFCAFSLLILFPNHLMPQKCPTESLNNA